MRTFPLPAIAAFLALILSFLAGCDPDAAEKKAIRATYTAIQDCELAGDGHGFAKLLTARSIPYYDRILEAANTYRAPQVAQLSAIERYIVLTVRHRIPLEERRSLDGRALLVRMISEGWNLNDEDESDNLLRLGEVRIKGEYARARVIYEGKSTGFWFEFIKENGHGQPDPTGTWKLDDPSCDPFYNDTIAAFAREIGMSEDDAMVLAEERDTGRPVRPDIWDVP